MTDDMPILQRRRIEAQVIQPIYEEMTAALGKDKAKEVLSAAIVKAAIKAGEGFAARELNGTSMESFAALYDLWTADDALEMDIKRLDETVFEFNVTRCRYAEMYRAMGLGEIGHLLSCNRDATFCQGYDKRLKLNRTQTLMQGASHCDFRYRLED